MTPTKRMQTREPKEAHRHQSMWQELAEMRCELANINATLRRHVLCCSRSEVRYLSEAEAAALRPSPSHMAGPQDTICFCEQHFKMLIQQGLQEELHVLTLNAAHQVMRSHQVTVGLLNVTQVHPREVFRPAIVDAAASIILVHNHPSGKSMPSAEDLKVTEDIEAAGKIVGIKLLDHIIVAREGCVSILEVRRQRAWMT